MKTSQCYLIVWAVMCVAHSVQKHPVSAAAMAVLCFGFMAAALLAKAKGD